MILNADQQHLLDHLSVKGQKLAAAKQAALDVTADVKAAVFDALDADVPLNRVAAAAGIQRSLVYHWLGHRQEAAV